MICIPSGDLRYIRSLGKGGCGEVFLAESKTLGLVAVKKTILHESDRVIQEFLNEAELLLKMNSPNIIRFYGTTKSNVGECIVMEYAVNGTLYHFLEYYRNRNAEDSLSWGKKYQIAHDISRGLFFMHSRGVLHRDLKSMNVLLDDRMKAKISDFGLSQIKTKNQISSSILGVQNNVFGSLLWKAPETFSIRNPYTEKADVYSLGIIFWELATCQVPYENHDPHTIESSVLRGDRLDIPSSCPEGFKELIEQCWCHDHTQRPSASNIFEKLDLIIDKSHQTDTSDHFYFNNTRIQGSSPNMTVTLNEGFESNNKNSDLDFLGSVFERTLTIDTECNYMETEVDKKLRIAKEKQDQLKRDKLIFDNEMRINEEKRYREEYNKRRKEEEEKKQKEIEEEKMRILCEIERENNRIEEEMKIELENMIKIGERRLLEEKEEMRDNTKGKMTKPCDFEGNIFIAAGVGKFSSVMYLLENGTDVNIKDDAD